MCFCQGNESGFLLCVWFKSPAAGMLVFFPWRVSCFRSRLSFFRETGVDDFAKWESNSAGAPLRGELISLRLTLPVGVAKSGLQHRDERSFRSNGLTNPTQAKDHETECWGKQRGPPVALCFETMQNGNTDNEKVLRLPFFTTHHDLEPTLAFVSVCAFVSK